MQLLLDGGATGTMTVDSADRDMPITVAVLATGVTMITGQLFVPPDVGNNVRAELIYRWWTSDEATDAGAWQTTGVTQTGPGKTFAQANIAAVNGLLIQLGLRLDDSTGGSGYGRAVLDYPVVLVS